MVLGLAGVPTGVWGWDKAKSWEEVGRRGWFVGSTGNVGQG